MSGLHFLALLVALLGALAYFRIGLAPATAAVLALLSLWTNLAAPGAVGPWVGWGVFAATALALNVPALRRRLLSDRIFRWFRRVMPAISETEREALEAGSVWWDGELFSGAPRWSRLLELSPAALSERERAFLDGPVEELARLLDDWEITHQRRDLPPEVWRFIKEQGFFGMIIPEDHGGLGFSALAHSAVVMKVASRSITAAVTIMVPNSLGPAELLLHYGTEAQKSYYLPRLARGEEVPCFALTGPEAGSDAASMPDRGVVCRGEFQGRKDVLGIRLSWEKRYITLGPVATVLGLAFKLDDPDHLLGEREELGVTLALIPVDTPGVEIGRRHLPLDIPFQNGPNRGRDVFIPLDWVIGGETRIGQGWRMLMEALAAGRSISLPALSTGAGKLASRATGAYARIRTQFNLPIGCFEGVQEALARIAAYTYQMDAVRTLTAAAVDEGEKPAVVSAIAKYNLTERMRRVVNDAMDIQGGSGICLGPRNLLGRVYQALPISITVEGANILTRSMIIFGQGAMRCHPYARRELEAAGRPDGARDFDQALFGHIGFTLGNLVRSVVLGLTGARLAQVPGRGEVRRYLQHLSRMSAAFALVADASMLSLGGALKRREKLSGRLADVLSQLYIASACVKRFHDQGEPEADLPLLRWACDDALFRCQHALVDLLRNYPASGLGALLRLCVFPLGQRYRRPDDTSGGQVAELLLAPSAARDRLTGGLHVPAVTSETLGRIEDALAKVIAAEPIERTLHKAIQGGQLRDGPDLLQRAAADGLISEEQAHAVGEARRARRAVIEVDDFPAGLGTKAQAPPPAPEEITRLDLDHAGA